MIDVSHLTKSYGDLTAVNDFSFNVQPGDKLYLPPEERVHVW